ncbi:MAG TPA: YbfB/YjiJ family MFS transporter, partial [Dongiaceae bacterium]|nr:YbfB/YjiJ family MFS transporter [Dongiaceae bacterium]
MNSSRPPQGTIKALPLVFGGFIALASAMGIGRFVYTPILPKMVADLGLSASEAGLIASANFAGYLIGALVAAASFFAARQRRWMLVGLAFSALSTAGMAATTSLPLFVILRFVGGVSSAFVLVFSSSLVMERLTAAGKIRFASYQFAGVGTGIALSAALVERLAANGIAWQWQWSATAFLSLLAFLAVAGLIGPAPQGIKSTGSSTANGRMSAPLLALVLSYGLFGFGYVITATFLVQL